MLSYCLKAKPTPGPTELCFLDKNKGVEPEPSTSSKTSGLVVPIPTLPELSILKRLPADPISPIST